MLLYLVTSTVNFLAWRVISENSAFIICLVQSSEMSNKNQTDVKLGYQLRIQWHVEHSHIGNKWRFLDLCYLAIMSICSIRVYTRVYENSDVSFAPISAKLCLAKWKSTIRPPHWSVTTSTQLSFSIDCTHLYFMFKFVFHRSHSRVNVPDTWKLEKVILKTSAARRKLCYNFTM